MKKYCIDCENIFKEEELSTCICGDCFGNEVKNWRIITKTGVKYINQERVYCKDCLRKYHKHEGEVFI